MNSISGVLLRLNVRVSTTYEVPPVRSIEMQGTYSQTHRVYEQLHPVRSIEMQGTYSGIRESSCLDSPVRSIKI